CTYWFYMLRIREEELTCSRDEFSRALKAEGIPNSAGYTDKMVYMQPMFTERNAYRGTHYPFDLAGRTYGQGLCPVGERILETSIRISLNEFFSEEDALDIV